MSERAPTRSAVMWRRTMQGRHIEVYACVRVARWRRKILGDVFGSTRGKDEAITNFALFDAFPSRRVQHLRGLDWCINPSLGDGAHWWPRVGYFQGLWWSC